MFYFDKENPYVLYCDNREFKGDLWRGVRPFEVKPDMIADFTALPFGDESFWHVVFDPPHLANDAGDNSRLVKKYGKLPKEWKHFIKAGFDECWRVLKTNGTLIFKWSEFDILTSELIKTIDINPIYGNRSGKASKTHWLVFVKTLGEEKHNEKS